MWLVKRLDIKTGYTFTTQWGSLKCLFTDIRLGTIIVGLKHIKKEKTEHKTKKINVEETTLNCAYEERKK